ncbi:MAG: hypothetical protein ACJ74O_03460 [Frankiaceae bacterium]
MAEQGRRSLASVAGAATAVAIVAAGATGCGLASGTAAGGAGGPALAVPAAATMSPPAGPRVGPRRDGMRHGRGLGAWRGAGRGLGPAMRARGLGRVLHAQLTVAAKGGGYRVVEVQRGSVQRVSATAVTVRSADGYVRTYGLDAGSRVDAGRDGIAAVKAGHAVLVVAARPAGSSGPATAVRLIDATLRPGLDRAGPAPGDGPGA